MRWPIRIALIVSIFLLVGAIAAALITLRANPEGGEPTAEATLAVEGPSAESTEGTVQEEPTEAPASTDTPVPTATPTRKGIRAASGKTPASGLAASVPTRVPSSPTAEKVKPTLRPGETPAPEGPKIDLGIPGVPTVQLPSNLPGYTPMATVHWEPPSAGPAATPTRKPTPCGNFLGIGCPAAPKSNEPTPTPPPPASGGQNQEGGGLPPWWLQLILGVVGTVIVLGIVIAVLLRTGVATIT